MRVIWSYGDGWTFAAHECARCLKQIRVVGMVKHIRTRTAEFYTTNPGGPHGHIFCTACRADMQARRNRHGAR